MQDARTSDLRGLALPRIMYGTAWKEDRTKPLVLEAIAAGFRAFDTANQRKHYVEEDVGAAVRTAIAAGTVTREDLFLKQSLSISAAKITASHTTLIAISPRNCANLSPAPLSTSV